MSRGTIRRAQLIAPFGVGALTVVPNGTSVIGAGLDHWYKPADGSEDSSLIDVNEFRVEEWRLEVDLRVDHFRLPPDWRTRNQAHGSVDVNNRIPIPYLRFPSWNFCPSKSCNRLQDLPLSSSGKSRCTKHQSKSDKRAPYVAQVPVVAICEYGHIQDFPFREWVHKSRNPSCTEPMRLKATGSASLAAQEVRCDCGKRRTLARITEASPPLPGEPSKTFLSSNLEDGEEYLCAGSMPWHAIPASDGCDRPLRGSLRAASNLYYALVRSAIYLPRQTDVVSEELVQLLATPPIGTLRTILLDAGVPTANLPANLRDQHRSLLQQFDDAEISAGIKAVSGNETLIHAPTLTIDSGREDDLSDETEFRRPEYAVLSQPISAPYLEIRSADLTDYDSSVSELLSGLMLIDKLRETRALYGFNRILPESGNGLLDRKSLLRKSQLPSSENWLPAYIVHGEGMFLKFSSTKLSEWAHRSDVMARVGSLQSNFDRARAIRQLQPRQLSPQLVLLHTLSHLLMNQLTFESGYSSAALRERLYVSSAPDEMVGLLIYTAAGDAEGTMGGLVRMGKPGYFEQAFVAALQGAQWCSADPVCMEIGEAGQGPESCNLAACHNCALVPETACEEFNRFLDRGLVVGTLNNENLGFFKELG